MKFWKVGVLHVARMRLEAVKVIIFLSLPICVYYMARNETLMEKIILEKKIMVFPPENQAPRPPGFRRVNTRKEEEEIEKLKEEDRLLK